MADSEFLNIGSVVCCTTCYNQKIQGEVIAFDEATKMLAIKSPTAGGKHNMYDVRIINISFVGNIKVIQECKEPPPPLSSINIGKINNRLKKNLEEKRRQVNYIGSDVSPEGQSVFFSIVKTLNDVKWEGKNIIVMDEVTIRPPYRVEDCRAKESSQVLSHVKKIVQKHIAEEQKEQRKSTSPSPVSSASSS